MIWHITIERIAAHSFTTKSVTMAEQPIFSATLCPITGKYHHFQHKKQHLGRFQFFPAG
jgi:hypothetical protein